MNLQPSEIESIEDVGTLNGRPVKWLRTKGGLNLMTGHISGSIAPSVLAAGSHRAICLYNLEKQYPEFQPNMMKSEKAEDNAIVKQHMKHVPENLKKAGYDIYSIQIGNELEFQITKHEIAVAHVFGEIINNTIVLKKSIIDDKVNEKEFVKIFSGATVDRAIFNKSEKIVIEK
jgi:hypothetical protein